MIYILSEYKWKITFGDKGKTVSHKNRNNVQLFQIFKNAKMKPRVQQMVCFGLECTQQGFLYDKCLSNRIKCTVCNLVQLGAALVLLVFSIANRNPLSMFLLLLRFCFIIFLASNYLWWIDTLLFKWSLFTWFHRRCWIPDAQYRTILMNFN